MAAQKSLSGPHQAQPTGEPPYAEPIRWSEKKIFGFPVSMTNVATIAQTIVGCRRTEAQGVGLIITPNIDHVVQLRRNPAFVEAYRHAEIIVCDGFPVRYYALLRGVNAGHVAGTDIAATLMREANIEPWNRLFFVVDSSATEQALQFWARRRGLERMVASAVPEYGFERDPAACASLARRIREHGTTILVMGVGAPRSEIFVDTHRSILPPCWTLCVGQAVKIEVGLVKRAPPLVRKLHGEWLWRILQEPRRLAGRYSRGGGLYLLTMIEDVLGRPAIPLDDPERIAALRQAQLLDTPPEEDLDQVARLTSRLLDAPIALLCLVDVNRQFFKSCIGSLPEPHATNRETPLSHSFCQYVVTSNQSLLVEDARKDPFLKDNALVTEHGIRAYAGYPISTEAGHVLGTLCILDSMPRKWRGEEIDLLRSLTEIASTIIRFRTSVRAAQDEKSRETAQTSPA